MPMGIWGKNGKFHCEKISKGNFPFFLFLMQCLEAESQKKYYAPGSSFLNFQFSIFNFPVPCSPFRSSAFWV